MKQKTAYEMRESDWSSDVCSSDLHGNYITLTDLDEAELRRIEEQRLSPLYVSVHATDPALRHELLGRPRVSTEILPRLEQIGRASCRERVYVLV